MQELLSAPALRKPDLGQVPLVSGAYAWWWDQPTPTCLKVGIATPRRKDGLRGRIGDHFTSSYGTTTFARHLHRDTESPWAAGRNFSARENRCAFLQACCYFRLIVLKELDEPTLRRFETFLEREMRPKYLG